MFLKKISNPVEFFLIEKLREFLNLYFTI